MALLAVQVNGAPGESLNCLLHDFNFEGIPTCAQLQRLWSAIDHECLRAPSLIGTIVQDQSQWNWDGEPVTPELILQLALYLSKPLYRLTYPGAARCREYQLRTLISALALLHHHNVTALSPTDFDVLHENIANRYYDLVSRPSGQNVATGGNDKARNTSALYLVRLAHQYASLFDRCEHLFAAHVPPLVRLVSAAASVVGLLSLGVLLDAPKPCLLSIATNTGHHSP